jgi:hypothetical protein
MAVFSASGMFGSGKTAWSCFLAKTLSERRGGVPIWCNFDLRLPQARKVYRFSELYDCIGGVVLLDELQGTVHARRSNKNLEFLAWFDQCRKQDSDVIVITQALHKIDIIVREMIEIGYDCVNMGGEVSKVTPIDLARERVRPAFYFDRRQSFGLYDHRQRAWALVEEGAQSAAEKARGKGGEAGSAPPTIRAVEKWPGKARARAME